VIPRSVKSAISTSLKNTLPTGVFSAVSLLGTEVNLYRLHRRGVKRAQAYKNRTGLKLNIGCGPNGKEGWIKYRSLMVSRNVSDKREPLPFSDDPVSIIYSEHFFKHLDYPNVAKMFLQECFRVLGLDGIFRLGVPDTRPALFDYEGVGDGWWRDACKNREFFRPEWCVTILDRINYHFRQCGEHKYAYDFETIENVLEKLVLWTSRNLNLAPFSTQKAES
jgi:predicted SAM-dependent methyltransferase